MATILPLLSLIMFNKFEHGKFPLPVLMNGTLKELDHATWCMVRVGENRRLEVISANVYNCGKTADAFWKKIDNTVFENNVVSIIIDDKEHFYNRGAKNLADVHHCQDDNFGTPFDNINPYIVKPSTGFIGRAAA